MMSLPAGTKLGPYEILAPIGAGGMGEVYLAEDMQLDRKVALKFSPSHYTKDIEIKERFNDFLLSETEYAQIIIL